MIWEQIRANRRRSAVLITVMAGVLFVLGYLGGEMALGPGGGVIGLGVALLIWGIQLAAYATSTESILLHGAFARELKRDDNPQLFNVVEEMKLASGLPFLPKIYLIDDPAPNAFAIGGKPGNSVIAVTTGLLHRLNRDELQGVIAHEIGHLRNQDVKFMTLAAVMLGSIAILSQIIWRTMRYGGRGRSRSESRGGGGQAQLIILVIGLLFAVLGPLMAQLLYFACSRKREYLADACSAQYTRYPEGLASALEKIAGARLAVASANNVTAPMFIVNPLQASDTGMSLFATHPATAERIRILRGMAGAGLADYEAAYRQAHRGGLIGAESLRVAPTERIRAASDEGPIQTRTETRQTLSRAHGYLPVTCSCGVQLSVPENHRGTDVRCVRCGNTLPLPAAQELRYRRRGQGWESFRCTCGRTIQLSPSFAAPHIRCTNCQQQIQIS